MTSERHRTTHFIFGQSLLRDLLLAFYSEHNDELALRLPPVSGTAAAERVPARLQPGAGRGEPGPPAAAQHRQAPAGREVPPALRPDHRVPGETEAAG